MHDQMNDHKKHLDFILRIISSLGRRVRAGDPEDLALFDLITLAIDHQRAESVRQFAGQGVSLARIGKCMQTSKQNIHQRFIRQSQIDKRGGL